MEKRLFTSESVTEGHPDKMCDAISDAILDNEELPESIDNIVYCLVSSMRKKIEPELKQCRYIKTVRGVGYKFEGKKMDIFPE